MFLLSCVDGFGADLWPFISGFYWKRFALTQEKRNAQLKRGQPIFILILSHFYDFSYKSLNFECYATVSMIFRASLGHLWRYTYFIRKRRKVTSYKGICFAKEILKEKNNHAKNFGIFLNSFSSQWPDPRTCIQHFKLSIYNCLPGYKTKNKQHCLIDADIPFSCSFSMVKDFIIRRS